MIPRLVHQTWKDSNVTNWIFRRSQEAISSYLPDWSYRLWTDADLDAFIRLEFGDYYVGWQALAPYIKRVDMARYCILHKFGGIYADLDFVFTRNVADLLTDGHDLYFYISTQAMVKGWLFLGNAFMVSAPGQPFWLDFMSHLLALPPDTPVLRHTGPLALGAFYESLPAKPNARIFGPEYFDNEHCADGVGARAYGYHVRTATWQERSNSSA